MMGRKSLSALWPPGVASSGDLLVAVGVGDDVAVGVGDGVAVGVEVGVRVGVGVGGTGGCNGALVAVGITFSAGSVGLDVGVIGVLVAATNGVAVALACNVGVGVSVAGGAAASKISMMPPDHTPARFLPSGSPKLGCG